MKIQEKHSRFKRNEGDWGCNCNISGSVQYNTPYINKEKLQWGFVLLYSSKQKYNTPALAYTGSRCLWSSSHPSKLPWIDASTSAHLISSCLVLGPNSLDLSALNNDYILLDIGRAALFGNQIEVVNRTAIEQLLCLAI